MRIRQLVDSVVGMVQREEQKREQEQIIETVQAYADGLDKTIEKLMDLNERNTVALESIAASLKLLAITNKK